MAKRRDREVLIVGAPAMDRRRPDEVVADLVASTRRCVSSAIEWGARDVGALRVLL